MINKSFLNLKNINEANKAGLLQMRQTLFASVVQNAKEPGTKYLVSLVVFTEFERLTRHITDSYITKN